MHRLFLEAHRELIELNSKNAEIFKDVVKVFEQQRDL